MPVGDGGVLLLGAVGVVYRSSSGYAPTEKAWQTAELLPRNVPSDFLRGLVMIQSGRGTLHATPSPQETVE